MKMFLPILFIVSMVGFFACSKKSDNPVAPTPGATELKLTLGTQQITFNQGIGGYAVSENLSYVQFLKAEAGDTLLFFLIFSGKQTGNQAWDPSQDLGALLYQYGNSGIFIYSPNQGSTNVTSYGSVGNVIAGNISGILEDNNGNNLSTSGNFSVQRSADIQSINNSRIIELIKQLNLNEN